MSTLYIIPRTVYQKIFRPFMLVSVEFNSAQYRRINVRGRGIVKEPLKVNIISLRERRERERVRNREWVNKRRGKNKDTMFILEKFKTYQWHWKHASKRNLIMTVRSRQIRVQHKFIVLFFFNFRIILYRFAWNPKRMEMDDFFLLNKYFFGPMDHTSWTEWTKIWLYTIYY